MKEKEVEALFALAGIPVLKIKPLIDGYGYSPNDARYFEKPPRCVWWFVKTPAGWIEIGWRKRVINIDWSDTGIKLEVTKDATTKEHCMVHAWSYEKALEYLKTLAPALNPQTK